MINHETSAPANDGRSGTWLDKLEQRLTADDVRVLMERRNRIQEFVRLGRKWKFFTIDADTSRKAGRDVMKYCFMPESGLAVMLENGDEGFENRLDMAIANNPRSLATMLLDQVDILKSDTKNPYRSTRFSREQLEKRFSEEDPVACVSAKPPPKTWPDWFAVIKRYELSPRDLENIYGAIDAGTWKGQRPAVDTLRSQSHTQMYQAIHPAKEGGI